MPLCLAICRLLVLLVGAGRRVSGAHTWARQEVLDRESQFTLLWNPQLDHEGFFHFSLRAVTKGYLGFGISDTGTMAGADLVIAWPEKGSNATVMDLHASQNGLPRQDLHSDWHLRSSSFNRKTGIFQVTLARRPEAFDDSDLPINEGPVQIIYSWGKSRALEHHGTNQRGSKIVYLLEKSNSCSNLFHTFDKFLLILLGCLVNIYPSNK